MKPVTYSWIGLSAAAPLVFLICIWVLAVYHSYRRYWRSVDLFLLAVFVQELLTALQVFIYALLSLMQPSSGILCGMFIWSMSATRALQAATVCSLLVDRALTSQWPYKYRFSVRRHQIRYHLVVLATMAALVGVAAILARPPEISSNFEECRFLPHSLHVRLALFLLSLYGILLVISAVSACVVQTTRSCRSGSPGPTDVQDMTPITHGTTGSSTTTASSSATGRPQRPLASSSSTASSTSSGRLGGGLHSASSTTDLVASPLRPYHNRGTKIPISKNSHRLQLDDFRWGASIGVALLCFLVNHIPYMCLLVLGTFFPFILPEWPMENLSLWLSLLEGLMLPLLLGLCDSTFGEAAVLSCSRQRPSTHKYGEALGPFRVGGGIGKDEVKSFPLTNGSLFSSLQTMNIDGPFNLFPSGNHKGHHPMGTRMGILSQNDIRGMVSVGLRPHPVGLQELHNNFGQLFYNPDGPSSMSSIERNGQHDPIYSDPLNKANSIDSSLKLTEDDHIYATLSETFSSMSSFSDDCLGDHHRCSSATTVANDDFEYHNPRNDVKEALGGRVRRLSSSEDQSCFRQHHSVNSNRPPAQLPPEAANNQNPAYSDHSTDSSSSSSDSSPAYSFRSSTSSDLSENMNLEVTTNSPHDAERILQIRASPRLGFFNDAFESETLSEKRYFGDTIVKSGRDGLNTSYQEPPTRNKSSSDHPEPATNTLTKNHRSSSLSMNDLDRFDPRGEVNQEEEMMFILPVKSESMLSLYRLYLAEDEDSGTRRLRYSVEVSRSESNLTELSDEGKLSSSEDSRPGSVVALHEMYQKRRVPQSAGSRVRRQHKIQRAKCVLQRARPVIVTHTSPASRNQNKESKTFRNKERERIPEIAEGVQLAVVDKMRRKNGIITIKDPSELSVEELFNVLGRASIAQRGNAKEKGEPETLTEKNSYVQQRNHPTTEYKKIFVSEYI